MSIIDDGTEEVLDRYTSDIRSYIKRAYDRGVGDTTAIQFQCWLSLVDDNGAPVVDLAFADIPCPTCDAEIDQPCVSKTDEQVPHHTRTLMAAAIRVLIKKGIES